MKGYTTSGVVFMCYPLFCAIALSHAPRKYPDMRACTQWTEYFSGYAANAAKMSSFSCEDGEAQSVALDFQLCGECREDEQL